LQKKGIVLKPFIIGIGLDESYIKSFGCVGKFYDASSETNFKSILNIVISQALNSTTAQVNLNDQAGRPTETEVDMTFYDELSGSIRYNYIHTINNKGVPDTIIIDPIGTYRMVVHTIPPLEKKGIELVAGKHNVIALDAPQGYLSLKMLGNFSPNCLVRKAGDMQTLNVQQFNKMDKYIVGKYDLEILTLPRTKLSKVDIAQSKTTTIELPQPGTAVIAKPSEGPASLFVEENNLMVFVCNLNPALVQENLLLQPGRYRVEFRPKLAKESVYTVERIFRVDSGGNVVVKMY
jgi:Ca-activated chloride channel family protein